MAAKVADDGRPLVRIGPVFYSASRAWLPILELAKGDTGDWVLAIDRHMRAIGQDVIPCSVVWRPHGADAMLQMENKD